MQNQLSMFNERRKCIEHEEAAIAQLLQKSPYSLLTSIPGMGILSAGIIAGELGPTILQYTADQIASYAGIVPRQKQSGGRKRVPYTFSAPKAANKYLKNALSTVAGLTKQYEHSSIKTIGFEHPLKAHFKKVALRGGASYMATAKKLIRSIVAIIRDETIYIPQLRSLTPQQSAIWIEKGTEKMIEKWNKAGINPNEQNQLGKWIKHKDRLICLILENK